MITIVARSLLRRDRVQLVVWLVGITLMVAASTAAVGSEFSTDAQRGEVLRLALATPALLALRGVSNGASLGSLVFFQLYAFLAVVVGLLNTFLATRHSRADEERGTRELLLSTPVRRRTPLVAVVLVGALVDLMVAILSAAAFTAAGLPLGGAVVAGLALGGAGFAFLGVALVLSQLLPTSRATNGAASAVVAGAYLARAAGDALGRPDLDRLSLASAWPSWVSPIGWGQQTLAFTDDRLAPLLLQLGLGVVTITVAITLQHRRELGQSLVRERIGPRAAGPGLRSDLGLLWRLQRATVLGWAVAGIVLGLFTGSLASAIAGSELTIPAITDVLGSLSQDGQADVIDQFIAAIINLVAILAAAAGVQAVLRLRTEEQRGATELLRPAGVSRRRWLLDGLGIGVVSVLVVLAGFAVAAAGSLSVAGMDGHTGAALSRAAAEITAAVVIVAVTALAVAALPRWSTALSWGAYALAVVIGLFGGLLQLPQLLMDLSPFTHVPAAGAQPWSATLGLLTAVALVTVLAVVAMRRRDLSP